MSPAGVDGEAVPWVSPGGGRETPAGAAEGGLQVWGTWTRGATASGWCYHDVPFNGLRALFLSVKCVWLMAGLSSLIWPKSDWLYSGAGWGCKTHRLSPHTVGKLSYMAAWISVYCIVNQNSYNACSVAAPKRSVARTLVQCMNTWISYCCTLLFFKSAI